MDREIATNASGGHTPVRRRPRYVLGTFWLLVGIVAFFNGFSPGQHVGLLIGLLALGYSVYLYRGGHFGFFFF